MYRNIIILLLLLCLLYYLFGRNQLKEGFTQDKFDSVYTKFYNLVFNNPKLYQHDVVQIVKNTMNNQKKVLILDAGCGVGRHYKYFSKKYSVIGLDQSDNMLKYAKIRNPGGNFIKGDMKTTSIFKPNQFSHIVCLEDSLYHNSFDDKMNSILENFYIWLKPKGYLCIHIFDREKLDPGPREFTQYYKDDKKTKHALTYFEKFTHDAYWSNDHPKYADYNEKIILENGKTKKTQTRLYIPKDKRLIAKKVIHHGFKLIDIINLKPLEIDDFELYIFRKK